MNESQDIKSCDSADLARMHPSILAFVGGVHRVGFYFDLGAVILKTRIRMRPFPFSAKRPPLFTSRILIVQKFMLFPFEDSVVGCHDDRILV